MTAYEFYKTIELLNAFEEALKSWNRLGKKIYEKDLEKKVKKIVRNTRQLDMFKNEEE